MSDRLQELLRQKALLSEHAAWLDREIAQEKARADSVAPDALGRIAGVQAVPAEPEAPSIATPPAPVAVDPLAGSVGSASSRKSGEGQPEPKSIQQDVRRGCLLWFAAALVLFGLAVVAIFWLYRPR